MTLNLLKSRRLALACATSLTAITLATTVNAADLAGKVVEATENFALEGALIEIRSQGLRTRTDSSGRFFFPSLNAGTYEISISYVGMAPVTRTVIVSNDNENITVSLGGEFEEIVVKGYRGSMNSSLNKKRADDRISEFLSADSVGDFPDQNIAEAARRLVGLSVETDQGEGRYVVVRGIDPALNSSSVNGVRLPSPEGDTRQVALDVIPSELIETLAVTKSATPDMDGDFIGGNTLNMSNLF